ncbi:MAG: hypothetical protein MAG795_00617 [Candidatus Woesearchaeota archaeon]|nr:hypothetical protein [Candidatus Woesearchaeota archaeon]
MKNRKIISLVFTILIFLLAEKFVYSTYMPINIHEHSHKISHQFFTDAECNITRVKDPSFDSARYEGYYHEVVCDEKVYGTGFYITKIVGYGAEIIIAFILLVSPFSLIGGVWFTRLSRNLWFEINSHNPDLFFINNTVIRIISILLVVLFFFSFVLQYFWICYILKLIKNRKNKNISWFKQIKKLISKRKI